MPGYSYYTNELKCIIFYIIKFCKWWSIIIKSENVIRVVLHVYEITYS